MATQELNTPPVVDLRDYEERKQQIVQELMHAATTVGFFYVKNHGVPQELIDAAFAANQQYFEQPMEEKLKLPRVDWGARKLIGYEINPLADGLLHESSIHCYPVHKQGGAAWPDSKLLPDYRGATEKYMNALPAVVDRILECFAVGLGLPEDHFKQMTNVRDCNNHTFLQYHKYPSVESLKWKPGTNRITPHTDETLITLLLPDPNSVGLELAAGSDGRAVIGSADGLYTVESWTPCPPLPGCITVNIGDPLQFISDGLLRSNYHRVRMPRADEPKGDRYSMGYFVWPRDQDVLQGPKQLYPKQTMAEFMRVKGKMYGNAFHPDPQVYEAQQHLAFGPPVVERPFQQVQVQG